jgi:hypothetical protein
MTNVRKKISELTTLASASLDTVVVGVDNGTTYKIELDVLADAVTSRVNILDRSRLSSLESVTSSFEAKGRNVISSSAQISALGFTTSSSDLTSLNSFTSSFDSFSASVHTRINAATNEQSFNGLISGSSQLTSSYDSRYVVSGSITQTTWDNISGKPTGLVSQSTDLTSLNNFTASISTASLVISINNLNSATASYETIGRGIISSSANLVTTTSFNSYTASISTASLVTSITNLNTYTASQSTSSLVNRLNAIESVSGSWITENETGSFLTSLNGAISSSSQLTSSFDVRYTLSGSVQPLPNNIISSSAQISAYGFISSSHTDITSLNSYTASNDTKWNTLGGLTGSYLTSLSGAISSSSQILGNSGVYSSSAQLPSGLISGSSQLTQLNTFTASISTASLVTSITNLNTYTASQSTASLVTSITNLNTYTASISTASLVSRLNAIESVSGSWITESETGSFLTNLNGAISSSLQVLGGSGIYSSSTQLPTGIISGSSQLTASYDTRYTLSGSVVSGTTPAGTISGSAQITAFGFVSGSYTTTSSFNSFTASAQAVTTGSNSFNGTQTITGSLIVTTGSFVGSTITANTSSLYLTSGSNMYVQNNGLVEISGSLLVSGSTIFTGSINISSGSITMPNRPAFRVKGAGGATAAITTLSGSMTIVDYNQGGWDNTTGTFTAPIAGLYQVNFVCRTNSNSSAQSVQVIVYKNYTGLGTGIAQVMVEWAANTTANHMGGSTISKLAVGDTLKALVTVGTASFDENDNFSVAYIG